MVKRNSLLLRLKIAIFGHAKLCKVGDLEFFAFHCPVHGVTTDYARGHDRYVSCSYCSYG